MAALIGPRSAFSRPRSAFIEDAGVALRHPLLVVATLLATIWLNYDLFRYHMNYGLFPVQDTGLIIGSIQADQSISFQSMEEKFKQLQTIVQDDPAVDSVVGFTGGRQTNSGFIYVLLKPYDERKVTADDVVKRLRGKLAQVAGARLHGVGFGSAHRRPASNATYHYTLLSDDTAELYTWAPKLTEALMKSDIVKDVNSDQQQGGLETDIVIDRDTAMRLGLTLSAIDNTLYDAFGQRQVSVIYSAQNQYHVVMEVAPRYWQDPRTLDNIMFRPPAPIRPAPNRRASPRDCKVAHRVARARRRRSQRTPPATSPPIRWRRAATRRLDRLGGLVLRRDDDPALGLRQFAPGHTPLSVNHQGLFAAATISFNLAPGVAERGADGDRGRDPAHRHAFDRPRLFRGTAATFQQSQSSMPMLFGAALLTIYIVLGILYESLIHPITILSTLFSASVGAALALWIFDTPFTVIAAIGVLLLIGIVKKNAIMMVDFALEAQREGFDRARRSNRPVFCAFARS